MNIRDRLSRRISMDDIHEITYLTQGNNKRKKELYDLLFDEEDQIAYQAAWAMNHYSSRENQWLYDKQDELINEAMHCRHTGKRRLILSLLYRQPLANPPRVDFLDFCLDRMISRKEPVGIRSLCMKIAYELCRPIPELTRELKAALGMMEGEFSPAIATARKNILKAMIRGKSIQIF